MPASISKSGLAIARNFECAYSAKYTADISPIGTATIIAIKLMRAVPAKIGTAPNEPSDAT